MSNGLLKRNTPAESSVQKQQWAVCLTLHVFACCFLFELNQQKKLKIDLLSLHPVKDELHFHLCDPDHRVGLTRMCLWVTFLFDYPPTEHWPELGYLGSTVINIQTQAGRWETGQAQADSFEQGNSRSPFGSWRAKHTQRQRIRHALM